MVSLAVLLPFRLKVGLAAAGGLGDDSPGVREIRLSAVVAAEDRKAGGCAGDRVGVAAAGVATVGAALITRTDALAAIAPVVAETVAGPATVPALKSPEPSIAPTPEAMPQLKLGWTRRVASNWS